VLVKEVELLCEFIDWGLIVVVYKCFMDCWCVVGWVVCKDDDELWVWFCVV